MRWPYMRLWALLATAFAVMLVLSTFDDLRVLGHSVAKVSPASKTSQVGVSVADTSLRSREAVRTDTVHHVILFIGDSMLEGLSPRFAAYAKSNGHRLYTVIWYGSTTEKWATSHRLKSYIRKFRPDYIVVCIGGNELFVRDLDHRSKMIDGILSDIGNLPYVWIGPPNWKPDTGINRLIASKVGDGHFFLSANLTLDRASDGAHPTHEAAAVWMDSVAQWIAGKSACPMRLDRPRQQSAYATRTIILTPDD